MTCWLETGRAPYFSRKARSLSDGAGRNQLVVFLIDDKDDIVLVGEQLENGDSRVVHEPGGYGAANETGKLHGTTGNILFRLDGGELVRDALRLRGKFLSR
jgi:hypothetical protein